MIAVDTNILVYAHRAESPKHQSALTWLVHLAQGNLPWAIPVFCLGEFIRVVTHRKVFNPPSTIQQAISALDSLLDSPTLRLLNPKTRFFDHLKEMLKVSQATGNLVFDAQIAAVCQEQGVKVLLTDDRDFARFPRMQILTLESQPQTI